MRSLSLSVLRCVALGASLVLPAVAAAAQGLVLRSSDGGDVRALIIGIDAYRHVRPLKGAVADAQDMDTSLRRMGARDVTTLIDAQADRASVLMAIDRLVARTQQKDLVVLSIAGHGAQEPEKVKGSEPDGMENVFLLPGFEPTATGSQQRILGREFNHFIKQFELRGAKVLFVADTCHGGGMARDVDPRAEEMSFRQVRELFAAGRYAEARYPNGRGVPDRTRSRSHCVPCRGGPQDQSAGNSHSRHQRTAWSAELCDCALL